MHRASIFDIIQIINQRLPLPSLTGWQTEISLFGERGELMSTTIEFDLKDILTKLDQKLDRIEQKFEQKFDVLTKDVSEIKTEVKVLQEKIGNIEKRLDGQAFWLRAVGGGIVVAALVAVLKMLGFIDRV